MTDLKTRTGKNSSAEIIISLVIPCYNVPEEQIRRALDSVKRQTFKDYEVIVVDDGSSKEFAEALDQLCAQLDHSTLIRTENCGVSAARNIGISAAKGEYIAFLDADDILTDDFMERAWQAASESGADFVIGGMKMISNPEDFSHDARDDSISYSLYRGNSIQELLPCMIGARYLIHFPGGYINRGPCSRLIRSEIINNNLFDEDLHFGEDIVFNIQLLNRCRTVCLVKESWYGYWQNPNSVNHSYNLALIEKFSIGLEKIAAVIDLNNGLIYSAYTDLLYELMHRCWVYYLKELRSKDRKSYVTVVKKIYMKEPWKELGSIRHIKTTHERKRKVGMLLFHFHFYFAAQACRDFIKYNLTGRAGSAAAHAVTLNEI